MKKYLKIVLSIGLLCLVSGVSVSAMKNGSCGGQAEEFGIKFGKIIQKLREAKEHDEVIFNYVAQELNVFCEATRKEYYKDNEKALSMLFSFWFESFVEALGLKEEARIVLINRLRKAALGKGFERESLMADRLIEQEFPEAWALCSNYLLKKDPDEKERHKEFLKHGFSGVSGLDGWRVTSLQADGHIVAGERVDEETERFLQEEEHRQFANKAPSEDGDDRDREEGFFCCLIQ